MTYSKAWRALLDTRSRPHDFVELPIKYRQILSFTVLTHHGVEIIRQIISYYAVLYLGIGQRLSLVIYQ